MAAPADYVTAGRFEILVALLGGALRLNPTSA